MTTNKIFQIVAAIIIGLTIMITIVYNIRHEESGIITVRVKMASGPVTRQLTVSAGLETDSVKLIDSHGYTFRIIPRIIADDIPYVIHWNGGPHKGKFEEHIPARNKRPAGWTSGNPGEGGADSLTFQLEPGYPDSILIYTLYPL